METCTAIFLNSMEERRSWKNIYPNRGWKINKCPIVERIIDLVRKGTPSLYVAIDINGILLVTRQILDNTRLLPFNIRILCDRLIKYFVHADLYS